VFRWWKIKNPAYSQADGRELFNRWRAIPAALQG
jgi:hypothetical protein